MASKSTYIENVKVVEKFLFVEPAKNHHPIALDANCRVTTASNQGVQFSAHTSSDSTKPNHS